MGWKLAREGVDMKSVTILASLIVVLGLFLFAARPGQEPGTKTTNDQPTKLIFSLRGSDLYHAYCASCHGTEGRGNGPAAPALIARIPDLTTIAKRNGGIYPSARIERIIAGEDAIMAHGSQEMPVWGPIFHRVEEDRDFGNVRLHNVTKYLETIQQK